MLRVLDLYCGAGGAGMGYHRAGLEVVGVDIDPQPAYPFEFVQADAVEYALAHAGEFDLIHASPPCQAHSALTKGHLAQGRNNGHVDLIPATRSALELSRRPWVIENVQSAPVRRDVTLCGETFGLGVIRHRWFELGGWWAWQPPHEPHRGRVRGWRHGVFHEGPYVQVYGKGGGKGDVREAALAMGIDWMTDRHNLVEAIPPAYTEWIGRQWIEQR